MTPADVPAALPPAPRASTVIVHRVAPAARQRFLAQQQEADRLAAAFPGYVGKDIYPPAEENGTEWVVVLHFGTPEALRRWLDSPTRADWLAKLKAEGGEFQATTLPTGFGAWVAGQAAGAAAPPGWKTALTVLLGIYPTVMLLTLFVGPATAPLGLAVAMLIGNALSVALLQWLVMPPLSKLLAPWLSANGPGSRRQSALGLALVLLALAGLTLMFRHWAG